MDSFLTARDIMLSNIHMTTEFSKLLRLSSAANVRRGRKRRN
jgi:hypothetical protein